MAAPGTEAGGKSGGRAAGTFGDWRGGDRCGCESEGSLGGARLGEMRVAPIEGDVELGVEEGVGRDEGKRGWRNAARGAFELDF